MKLGPRVHSQISMIVMIEIWEWEWAWGQDYLDYGRFSCIYVFLCSYFKYNQLYGLSCFEKIPVASEEERGIRMKCVGLLAVGYSDLHLHRDFLQRQVRY